VRFVFFVSFVFQDVGVGFDLPYSRVAQAFRPALNEQKIWALAPEVVTGSSPFAWSFFVRFVFFVSFVFQDVGVDFDLEPLNFCSYLTAPQPLTSLPLIDLRFTSRVLPRPAL
jgi:hypothetical protein